VTKLTIATDNIKPYPYQKTNVPIFKKSKAPKVLILIHINLNL